MSEDTFQLDIGRAPAKPKVSGGMVTLVVLTFLCFAAAISLQAIEYYYMRGKVSSDTDVHAAKVLLPVAP
jgi:hypothetical protein